MSRNRWFEPTEEQKTMIRERWGKCGVTEIAAEIGVSNQTLSTYARGIMGLPSLAPHSANQNAWTADEDDILIAGIRAGINTSVLCKRFPKRSALSVKARRCRLVKLLQADVDVAADVERRRAMFRPAAKPVFGKLKFTIDDCPRVSLEYACRWAKQARKGWQRPLDDRQAWLEINAMRLYGEIPVPPFLPAARAVPDDLPNWDVGLAA